MNILLKGGRIIDPSTGTDAVMDLRIAEGRIRTMGKEIAPAAGEEVRSVAGAVVAPGFMDMHVHFREPGYEHKETIATGCAAAAAGGFTAVACMPNTNPAIDDESVIRFIQARARLAEGGAVDVHPIGAVTAGRKGEHLAPLAEMAAAGAVGFSDDGDPVHDAEIMRRALEYAAMLGRPIIQHAQDLPMTKGGVMHEGFHSTALGLGGMPGVAEEVMIARDLMLAEYTGGRYHVAHISTARAVELVRQAKARGVRATAEVTPHHVVLTDEAVRTYDTNVKMNPPLRLREDVEAVRRGLQDGTLDVIATDHAPHSFDEKQVEFQAAPFGIVGLETAVGLALTHLVHTKVLSLPALIAAFSVNPRRILGLPTIHVREGEPANLTIFHPSEEWVVDVARFRSRSSNSPFGGWKLQGRPLGIINNGVAVWGGA
jgi:dihydroorotase